MRRTIRWRIGPRRSTGSSWISWTAIEHASGAVAAIGRAEGTVPGGGLGPAARDRARAGAVEYDLGSALSGIHLGRAARHRAGPASFRRERGAGLRADGRGVGGMAAGLRRPDRRGE